MHVNYHVIIKQIKGINKQVAVRPNFEVFSDYLLSVNEVDTKDCNLTELVLPLLMLVKVVVVQLERERVEKEHHDLCQFIKLTLEHLSVQQLGGFEHLVNNPLAQEI